MADGIYSDAKDVESIAHAKTVKSSSPANPGSILLIRADKKLLKLLFFSQLAEIKNPLRMKKIITAIFPPSINPFVKNANGSFSPFRVSGSEWEKRTRLAAMKRTASKLFGLLIFIVQIFEPSSFNGIPAEFAGSRQYERQIGDEGRAN